MDEQSTAIQIKDLSKKFKVYHKRESQLKYMLMNLMKGKRTKSGSGFWALKNIDMEIPKGKTVGFIGRNGSGKSTLLKLISRILYPDGGEINAYGKISTLIELGSGFHPELSGRENVYINASILGFSREEVNKKFDRIVRFSGLEEFIDNPVKTYSSGMYVRLGFSVAINIDPDILLVDEVLAVGDELFQKKCIRKINELKKAGKTIVFVSHDLSSVEELCDHVYLLHNGRLMKEGKPVEVIAEYHKLLIGSSHLQVRQEETPANEEDLNGSGGPGEKNRWGSKEVEITGVSFLDKENNEIEFAKTGEPFRVRIGYHARSKVENPVFGIAIYNDTGGHITGPNTRKQDFLIESVEGKGVVEYAVDFLPLLPGTYLFTAAVYDSTLMQAFDHWEQHWKFHVIESEAVAERFGLITIPSQWKLEAL
ncbi:MAG: ABC transporter ATP-binding protein [bacterium]|nr:ABC transporter ATP-binding protein [bacterium]